VRPEHVVHPAAPALEQGVVDRDHDRLAGRASRHLTISPAAARPNRSTSHTAAEKNRHAAWNEIRCAIPAPASIPTTLRRPVCATIPVASTVNIRNVPRRANTGANTFSVNAHDSGMIMDGT